MGDVHTLCITAGSGNSFKLALNPRAQALQPNISPARFFSHIVPHVAVGHADDFPRWHHDGCAALAG